MADHLMKLTIWALIVLSVQVLGQNKVDITILDSAVPRGAVCLDGTPPAYHYSKGSGEGSNNWMIFLQGGGWCVSEIDCYNRTKSDIGSSNYMAKQVDFQGILSPVQGDNPYFYNWNRVYVRYCDGASYTSDVEEVNPANNLYLRGARILKAMVDEMQEKGMNNATNVVLAGFSAGGLATMLQCDNFRAMVPNAPRVKCISDAGFFIHAPNLPGATDIREKLFSDMIEFHKLEGFLPKSCTSRMSPKLCAFPEYFVKDIQTPLFIVNSAFDTWQLSTNMPNMRIPGFSWTSCVLRVQTCAAAQANRVIDFGAAFMNALPTYYSPSNGMLIDSCICHEQTTRTERWNNAKLLSVDNKTISSAVGGWYFDESSFQGIQKLDLEYDCYHTFT